MPLMEYLFKAAAFHQASLSAQAPVIKVSSNHQWLGRRNFVVDESAKIPKLAAAVLFSKSQVHANGVYRRGVPGRLKYAVQHASFFVLADRYINVVEVRNRKLRQDRVAVMSVRIHSVPAVSKVMPDRVSQELILAGSRPPGQSACVAMMRAQHFLQEYDVCAGFAYRVPQLMQNKVSVKKRKSLVSIYREYFQCERRIRKNHLGR